MFENELCLKIELKILKKKLIKADSGIWDFLCKTEKILPRRQHFTDYLFYVDSEEVWSFAYIPVLVKVWERGTYNWR